MVEFTLTGIPLIFILISTFEMARGMWIYQTLSYTVKAATRYVSVHGNGCSTTGNTCGINVGSVATYVRSNGVGLVPDLVTLRLTDASGSIDCPTLTSCLTSTTSWPTTAGGATGSDITITGTYAFRSSLAMLWPGAGQVSFAQVNFPASARAAIEF